MKSNKFPQSFCEVFNRLTEKGTVEVTARFNDHLVEEGYNKLWSASSPAGNYASVGRLPCREILSGHVKDGDTVVVM